jgi:Type II secretion system (T2SS), protein M subtype b
VKKSIVPRWLPTNPTNWALAGYIVFVLLGAGMYLLISNIWMEGELNNRELIANYDRMRAVAAYTPILETNEKEGSYVPAFLKKGTGAELTATIQSKLKEIALSTGAQVNSASALKIKTNGPIALVGANLQMSGSTLSVYDFISEVETAKPELFVDRILIRSDDGHGDITPKETILTVEIDVYGAILSDDLIGKAENP